MTMTALTMTGMNGGLVIKPGLLRPLPAGHSIAAHHTMRKGAASATQIRAKNLGALAIGEVGFGNARPEWGHLHHQRAGKHSVAAAGSAVHRGGVPPFGDRPGNERDRSIRATN